MSNQNNTGLINNQVQLQTQMQQQMQQQLQMQNKTSKIYKYKKEQCEEYMISLMEKCEKTIPQIKKATKINDENIVIPTIETINLLTEHNFNAQQLKIFAKHYKIKTTGNKQQLFIRIYSFLKLSKDATKIQKIGRGYLQKKYNKLHGPAFFYRKICTNDTDFLTGDELQDIPYSQFISYRDNDDFVYGFDMISLYNLVVKSLQVSPIVKNPYNRNNIPSYLILNIKSLIRISKILRIPLDLVIQDDTVDLSDEKTIELRALSLFQNIDSLGNYSSPTWFLSLNRNQTIKMFRELIDIWDYRAQINNDTKRAICPPHGILMNHNLNIIFNEQNLLKLRKYMLDIMERLVNSGIDNDSKTLGAYYVLGALTIVSENAATSLPWLFQSFSPIL
jgi:hypothetical protein